ncbi:MAG TPA: tetratricopeptide repeat protein [Pyrinomonadaceae bacterium]|nr:tetratricopeptide repeat protein [Pyrinomonadaceae bacterium]
MKNFIALILAALCTLQSGAAQAQPRLLATPQTRDTWRSVRTNNMFVIGNADPEKLRQVAAWLEFFHRSFARLISRNVINSSIPTTVIIFKDEASFRPFKPFYQGRSANISGYFQPGDDVNYIAISLDPRDRDPFGTAFHEYVHLHLKDNIPNAPLWLNEGLAELYGSLQFSGNDALLGAPIYPYLQLLRGEGLIPLTTLFSIGTDSPHYNEDDKTGIFYGQSWALVHYLMLGDSGRQEQFKRFLQMLSSGSDSAKAIESAFGINVATLEEELRSYVRRGNFAAQRIATVDNPQTYGSYTAMQRSALSEGEANYYLGDLLQHAGRDSDAERYLKQAIALDPGFTPPYASLGVLYVRQHRYAEAKKYLEKATSSEQNYLVHYLHAYVLSRENISADGRVSGYSAENAAAMREQLLRSIKLDPNYAPAPYLLALVDLVRNERLDEAVEMAQKARQLAPGKKSYSLLLARIYLQRSDLATARQILEPLARDSDQSVKTEAQELLDWAAENRSGAKSTRSSVSASMDADPIPTGTSRVLGGETGSVAINDGRTIQASGSMPSVDEVLAKYAAAVGGPAIDAMKSRIIRGTVDVVGVSRGGVLETYEQAPNLVSTMIEAHPLGKMRFGFNGRTGWTQTAAGVKIIKNPELLAVVRREADFYGQFKLKGATQKITLAGMSKIGYRDVYVLDLQSAKGQPDRLYLDAQTYLPVRTNTVSLRGDVLVPVEIYLDDWREVDGIKYPFSVSQNMGKLTLVLTVTEVKHNVQIDPKVFEP